MPYHLPDDDEIGTCTITFDLPSDEKWATVIIGAISELAIEANWEPDTGDLTPAQAAQVAIDIIASVEFQAC